MKFKSKMIITNSYIDYLDEEHREHTLLDEKLIEKVKKMCLKIDRWYNIIITKLNDTIKEIKLDA